MHGNVNWVLILSTYTGCAQSPTQYFIKVSSDSVVRASKATLTLSPGKQKPKAKKKTELPSFTSPLKKKSLNLEFLQIL